MLIKEVRVVIKYDSLGGNFDGLIVIIDSFVNMF